MSKEKCYFMQLDMEIKGKTVLVLSGAVMAKNRGEAFKRAKEIAYGYETVKKYDGELFVNIVVDLTEDAPAQFLVQEMVGE